MALKRNGIFNLPSAAEEKRCLLEADDEYRINFPDGRELKLVRHGIELRSGLVDELSDEAKDITILDSSSPLMIRPILPNLPLVLQSESDLRILPDAHIRTSVSLPLGIALIEKDKENPIIIREFHPVTPSKTWFGTPDDGEAAYSWKTALNGRPLPSKTGPWEAVCPLIVKNDSPEILEFQRMILRVPELSLFTNGRIIATNSVTIRFRGETQASQVTFEKKPEGITGSIVKLAGPRVPVDRALLRRSFAFIKTISMS